MDKNTIFNLLLWAQFGSGVLTWIALSFLSAPYGRHARGGWGPSIPAKPAWILMEFPAVAVIAYFFFTGNSGLVPIVFILIWQLHYMQRTFVFPFLIRGGKPWPLIIALCSVAFNAMNGALQGLEIFHLRTYDSTWLSDPRFILGTILFLIGYAINLHADHILRSLRKPGETGYKIPNGGMHNYVASPNYFGELLEWIGWAVLTWSLAGLAFAFFTAANLVPRAVAHHRWYRETFVDYPKNRKRIIPFIY